MFDGTSFLHRQLDVAVITYSVLVDGAVRVHWQEIEVPMRLIVCVLYVRLRDTLQHLQPCAGVFVIKQNICLQCF